MKPAEPHRWLLLRPWTFRRAKERRRVIRGTLADRIELGRQFVRESLVWREIAADMAQAAKVWLP